MGLLRSCLFFTYSHAFCSKWLTQTSVDCNKFDKGDSNEVHIEWTLEEYMNKRPKDKKEPN